MVVCTTLLGPKPSKGWWFALRCLDTRLLKDGGLHYTAWTHMVVCTSKGWWFALRCLDTRLLKDGGLHYAAWTHTF